jgi:RimJ/RimL family protein N-acetyltransferase
MSLNLRPATSGDMMTIFEWANDPDVRILSFSQDPISIEEHEKWFSRKIKDETCIYLILLSEGKSSGQIRFDRQVDNSYVISFGIAREFRGRGLGTSILRLAEDYLIQTVNEKFQLIGYVKKENIASIISFKKNGYTQNEADPNKFPASFVFKKQVNEKY